MCGPSTIHDTMCAMRHTIRFANACSATRSCAPCCRCGHGWCSVSSSSCGCRWSPSCGWSRRRSTRAATPPGYLFRKLTVVHQLLNPLWRFRTSGVNITDPRRPYIVVANHQSFVDILLISQLPWEMKWLSKEDFFKYPLVGWLMRMAGDIQLVRGSRESIVAAMDSCRDRLSKRVSVMIFPEGTRSSDGELQKFKNGAFRLAIETGMPILPLALDGTHPALQKGDWRFGVTDAEVRVLAPDRDHGADARRRVDAA